MIDCRYGVAPKRSIDSDGSEGARAVVIACRLIGLGAVGKNRSCLRTDLLDLPSHSLRASVSCKSTFIKIYKFCQPSKPPPSHFTSSRHGFTAVGPQLEASQPQSPRPQCHQITCNERPCDPGLSRSQDRKHNVEQWLHGTRIGGVQ